jgi:hypothetical protein
VSAPDTPTAINPDQATVRTDRLPPTHADHDDDVAPPTVIQEIERVRTSADTGEASDLWTLADEQDDGLQLPGFGTERSDCGDDLPFFCECCGEVSTFGRTCRQSKCPRCAPAWTMERATVRGAKLLAQRAYLDSIYDDHIRLHHLVVQPPNQHSEKDAWCPAGDQPARERARDTVKRCLKKMGVLGGLILYHPLKGRDGDDRGEWKERLPPNPVSERELMDELDFRPHYHVIGLAHEVPGGNLTREIESETGWIFKRILKKDSSVSLYDDYDVARATAYSFSHTGTYESDQGNRRVAAWAFAADDEIPGDRDLQEVTADPLQEANFNMAVRSVAPKILGLDLNKLACGSEREPVDADDDQEEHDDLRAQLATRKVDVDRAAASARALPSAPVPDDDLLDRHDADPGAVDGDDLEAEPDAQRCDGRMLMIGKAAPYVESDAWRAQAPYADETTEKWEECRDSDIYTPSVDAMDTDPATVESLLAAREQEADDPPPQ